MCCKQKHCVVHNQVFTSCPAPYILYPGISCCVHVWKATFRNVWSFLGRTCITKTSSEQGGTAEGAPFFKAAVLSLGLWSCAPFEGKINSYIYRGLLQGTGCLPASWNPVEAALCSRTMTEPWINLQQNDIKQRKPTCWSVPVRALTWTQYSCCEMSSDSSSHQTSSEYVWAEAAL